MRAELERVEPDAGDPLVHQMGVLTRREPVTIAAATGGQELAWLPAGLSEIIVNRLSRLLRQPEPDRATGLLLRAPEVKAKLVTLGFYPVGVCGAEFADYLRQQYDEYGRTIRDANIKAE